MLPQETYQISLILVESGQPKFLKNKNNGTLILHTNDRHPVKPVNYTTKVINDKTIRKEKDILNRVFAEVQERSFGPMDEHQDSFRVSAMSQTGKPFENIPTLTEPDRSRAAV